MIRQIAAMDSRRGIATESGIPWKLPSDTAYFHEQTARGLILMGWATYNEFAAPLHGRENFVLTTGPGPLRTGFRAIGTLTNWSPPIEAMTYGSLVVPRCLRRRSTKQTSFF